MKHYRILRLAGLHYNTPMVALYENNPGLESQPYAQQQKVLFQNAYVYADSFSRTMKTSGHDAHEIVYDLQILQQTWAKEKGIKYDPDRWQHDIILAQIEDIKPDVIFFQGIYPLPHSLRKDLKAYFPFLKLIVIYTGYPGLSADTLHQLADADVLLVGSPVLVEKCKDAGLRPHLVYHSFDDAILEKIGANDPIGHNPKYDFTFIGSSGYGYGAGHQSRYWALVELIQRTNLELWVHDRAKRKESGLKTAKAQRGKSLKRFLEYANIEMLGKMLTPRLVANKLRRVILETIEQKREASEQNHHDATKDERKRPIKPLREMFPHRCHAPVFGIEMYRILHQSKVTFNKHSDPAEDTVGNMRMFEATGVGTCLLTDTGKNISDLFEEDDEVVTYSSIEECIEKASYLLEHDDVRRKIAAAGQRRTLKDHTVKNRCQQIDDILQKTL